MLDEDRRKMLTPVDRFGENLRVELRRLLRTTVLSREIFENFALVFFSGLGGLDLVADEAGRMALCSFFGLFLYFISGW